MEGTTLILGAGASIPYGFPSGESLITKVLDGFVVVHNLLHGTGSEERARQAKVELQDKFINQGYESVDQYLRDKEPFSHEIRATVFKIILDAEIKNYFSIDTSGQGKKNWYKFYFNRLMKDKSAIEKLPTQNVISFNYDRSFEYFLFRYIEGRMNFKSDQEVFALLHEKFNIHHVHGRLPNLPGENIFKSDDLSFPYGGEKFQRIYGSVSQPAILKKYITTVYEHKETTINYQEILKNSKRVLFLGFGYLEDNMEKIGVSDLLPQTPRPSMYGTGFGMGSQQVADLVNRGILINTNRNHDCHDFFTEFVPPIIK